jgi:hypothetical protein
MRKAQNGFALVVGMAAQLGAGVALAQNWTPQALKVTSADPNDTARTENGRLRATRYEETNEQAVVKLFADGKNGLYCEMRSGALNGVQPVHRQQAACTPIALAQNTDGSVSAKTTGTGQFVTDNIGQDYRNANKPEIMPINGGNNMLLMFNYRPQGTNDTNRYVKVLDKTGKPIPITDVNGVTRKQVLIMHKDNDNCDMHQSGEGPCDVATDANGATHLTCWAGCNGNGQDDGWINDVSVTCTNDTTGNATGCQVVKNFDASLCQREERSRGRCTVADADPNTAICTWTEGNDQPQRDGTWIGAVDIGPNGEPGEGAQSRVLWKKKIEDQKVVNGVRTYSVRANSTRVLLENADGSVARSNQLIIATADLRGNNTNDRKGGRYIQQMLGVAQADKNGLTWVVPMTNISEQVLGIDATHLTMTGALVQDSNKKATLPAITFLQGSQNGGGLSPADLKVLGVDFTAKKFVDYGTHSAGAPYDRHLYSNYLGGNPRNQGRNFAGSTFVKNPFVGQNGATSKYLLLHALTGKDPADVMKPEIKPSSYVSIMAMENPAALPPPPAGMPAQSQGANGSGGGQNSQPQPQDPPMPPPPASPEQPQAPTDPAAPSDPAPTTPTTSTQGGFSGGCAITALGAPGAADGVSFMFVLGGLALVGLARRRRS